VTQPHLPGLLSGVGHLVAHWGYPAVGLFVLLEDFGVPVPGETVLVVSAVYAGAGRLNVVAVGVIALAAAIVGDNIGYAIGAFGGRPLIERFGRYILLTPERIDRAEAFFARQGGKVVVVARFIEGLRQANGIIAGASEMTWRRFVFFNALGALLWVAVWLAIGYSAGGHIGAIYSTATHYELYLLIVVGVALLLLVARAVRRRRRRARIDQRSTDHERT
jgi:membrane protein DedA with SNARE-associated domain